MANATERVNKKEKELLQERFGSKTIAILLGLIGAGSAAMYGLDQLAPGNYFNNVDQHGQAPEQAAQNIPQEGVATVPGVGELPYRMEGGVMMFYTKKANAGGKKNNKDTLSAAVDTTGPGVGAEY